LALLVIGDATGIDRNVEHALAAEAASRRLPFTVVHLSEPSLRAVYGDGTVLVRPDQHIAWRGTSLPGGGATAVLDHVLGASCGLPDLQVNVPWGVFRGDGQAGDGGPRRIFEVG